MILQYQQRLYTTHSVSCRFRKPSEYLIHTSLVTSSLPLVVPTLLSRALPQPPLSSSLELVEQIRPWNLFLQKFIQLYPYIHALDTTTTASAASNSQPSILPNHIQYYDYDHHHHHHHHDSITTTSSISNKNDNYNNYNNNSSLSSSLPSPSTPPQSLTARLVAYMVQQQRQHIAETGRRLPNMNTPKEIQDAEITIALIITGWDLQVLPDEDDVVVVGTDTASPMKRHPITTPHIHCIFCLSRQPLINCSSNTTVPPERWPNESTVQNDTAGSNKRQRTTSQLAPVSSQWNQPYMAHRYYCPWVCGFPLTTQLPDTIDNGYPVPTIDPASAWTDNTLPFSLPLWQVLTNRLLMEAQIQPHTDNDDNGNNNSNDTMIQNFLSIHQQLRSSISPLRYKTDNTYKTKSKSMLSTL